MYLMLHTNFQGHHPFDSREENFFKFLPNTGMAAIQVMWPGPFEQTFIHLSHWGSFFKFGFNRPSGFLEKEVWKCWIRVTLDQGQWITLTFHIHIGSCTHLVNCIYQLWHHCFTFFPYKNISEPIWPCHKIGPNQPRVINWTSLVVLEHPMLHTKFQGGSAWNLASIGPVVSEMFENVDTHTYIRMTKAYLYYKLTTETNGSTVLKRCAKLHKDRYEIA